jgi:carbon monoxide dehydrogenase subunit G
MEFEAEHRFEGSRQDVWDALHDPDTLSRALPGSARMELTEDGAYVGELRAGVGPVTAARFDVKVTLADEVPPGAFTMIVDGRGAAGFVEGPVRVRLEEDGPDVTLMKYAADLQIGGRIAGVGQRLLDSVGKGMARKSLEEVNQYMREQAGADAAVIAGAEDATDSLAGVHTEISEAAQTLSRPLVISVAAIIVIIILVILL